MKSWFGLQALWENIVIPIAAYTAIKDTTRKEMLSVKIKPSKRIFGENIFIIGEQNLLIYLMLWRAVF